MNHLFYNPKANNGEAYKDLDMIKRTLDGQTVREYNLLEFDDYTDPLEQIRPEDVVYIVGGDGTLNRFIPEICPYLVIYTFIRPEPAMILSMMLTRTVSFTESG